MQCTEIFKAVKMKNFSRLFYVFVIFAQNIDCGYTLEPPRRYNQLKVSFCGDSKNIMPTLVSSKTSYGNIVENR